MQEPNSLDQQDAPSHFEMLPEEELDEQDRRLRQRLSPEAFQDHLVAKQSTKGNYWEIDNPMPEEATPSISPTEKPRRILVEVSDPEKFAQEYKPLKTEEFLPGKSNVRLYWLSPEAVTRLCKRQDSFVHRFDL